MTDRPTDRVENLSLFALIYLAVILWRTSICWESFITLLDILKTAILETDFKLRIFHYSPWYTYYRTAYDGFTVENLSLLSLIYLTPSTPGRPPGWESFITLLDILTLTHGRRHDQLRIFHYSPWYTYTKSSNPSPSVENLSLLSLIYLGGGAYAKQFGWESFITLLDILSSQTQSANISLRIFQYQPWYTYQNHLRVAVVIENLSLFTLIHLSSPSHHAQGVEDLSLFTLIYLIPYCLYNYYGWESFITLLDILMHRRQGFINLLRIFHYSPWYT